MLNSGLFIQYPIPWGARNASEAFALNDYNEAGARVLRQEVENYVDDLSAVPDGKNIGRIASVSPRLQVLCAWRQ